MSFCDAEEMQDWRNILKLTGQKIPVVEGHPFPMAAANQVVINLPKNKEVVRRPNAVAGFNSGNSNNKRRFSGGSGRAR